MKKYKLSSKERKRDTNPRQKTKKQEEGTQLKKKKRNTNSRQKIKR